MSVTEAEWQAWLDTRPPSVQKVGEQIKPYLWYVWLHHNPEKGDFDSSEFAVYRLYSINEDGTVTVIKHELLFGGEATTRVFGVHPSDLKALPPEFDFDKWKSGEEA